VQASTFGSVLPAAWSYMLAARTRGLGTVFTTLHLFHEAEAAALLGIPDHYMQVGLIPTAHLIGEGLSPGPRRLLDEFRRWNAW
jgi:nitroreductase